MEAHRRLVVGDTTGDVGHHTVHDVERDRLDVLQVALVAHPDLHEDRQLLLGLRVVGHVGPRQAPVGDDHQVVRQVAHHTVAPVDVDDVPLLPAAEPDIVARLDRLRGEDVDAGEEVGEGVLQREGDRETADAEGGDQRGDGHPDGLQGHEHAHRQHHDPRDVHEDGRGGGDPRPGLRHRLHETRDDPGRGDRGDEDEHGGQGLVHQPPDPGGEGQRRHRHGHAGDDRGPRREGAKESTIRSSPVHFVRRACLASHFSRARTSSPATQPEARAMAATTQSCRTRSRVNGRPPGLARPERTPGTGPGRRRGARPPLAVCVVSSRCHLSGRVACRPRSQGCAHRGELPSSLMEPKTPQVGRAPGRHASPARPAPAADRRRTPVVGPPP